MGRALLARQKANGHIGQHRVDKLYDAGLIVVEADDYERLKAELADAKRRLALAERIVHIARFWAAHDAGLFGAIKEWEAL